MRRQRAQHSGTAATQLTKHLLEALGVFSCETLVIEQEKTSFRAKLGKLALSTVFVNVGMDFQSLGIYIVEPCKHAKE